MHQRAEIECPRSCPSFRDADAADSRSLQSVTKKLIQHTLRSEAWCRQAVDATLGEGQEPGEWEQANLLAYLAYGHADGEGRRMVDRFAEQPGQLLSVEERAALEALKGAWFSLFEAQEVKLDQGLQLLDLVTGAEVFVHERLATRQMARLDLILGWLVRIKDHYELTGAACNVPRPFREQVLRVMKQGLKRARKARPEATDQELLLGIAAPAQRTLREAVTRWRPPKVVNIDGQEMMLCEAIFDLSGPEGVRRKLVTKPNIIEDEQEGRFLWIDRRRRKQLASGPLLLGTIVITGGRLVLQTKSRERLERGKRVLSRHLGRLVRHRLDTIKDLDVALSEPPRSRPPEDQIPAEDQAELVSKVLMEHLMRWIDMEIPALGGMTPREAVRSRRGRERVRAMLKDQEHIARGMPGGDRLDFSAIYRELGLRD
jgi:hypothetical protein